MNLTDMLKDPAASLRGLLSSKMSAQPVWTTPHTWADELGMYANDQVACVYRELPSKLLRDQSALEGVLRALATALPGRDVQLLVHVREHLQEPQADLPAALAAFHRENMHFLVPTRSAVIGVQLRSSAPAKDAPRDGALAGVADELLGETVPDLAAYDADRAVVDSALVSAGAQAMSRSTRDFLESWYTLGVSSDIEATERDEMIVVSPQVRMEFATAGPLKGPLTDGALPQAFERGVMTLSIRGTLAKQPSTDSQPERGVLMRASVIYGRLATKTYAPLPVCLRDMANVVPRPLPLRQLAALHETLPCSPRRLAPTHQRIGAAELRAFGFGDPAAPGADSGLLLGTGGAQMSRPVFVDPLAGNGVGVILGAAGAGKTFAAELLAAQAQFAGLRLVYISDNPQAGAGLSALAGTGLWAPSAAGDLDPFRWLPHRDALDMHRHLLRNLSADLDQSESAGIDKGFSRATQVTVNDLSTVLKLADGTTGVAKVLRALRRAPATQLLVAAEPGGTGQLPAALRVDLTSVRADQNAIAVALATLVLHAVRTATSPTFLMVDAESVPLDHPAVASAVKLAAAEANVALFFTASAGAPVLRSLSGAAHRLVLSTQELDAVRFVGADPIPELMRWLAEASPVFEDATVELPAAGLYCAPGGKASGVQVGPWSDTATGALTRGRAGRGANR